MLNQLHYGHIEDHGSGLTELSRQPFNIGPAKKMVRASKEAELPTMTSCPLWNNFALSYL
jgi:hypothetical protein